VGGQFISHMLITTTICVCIFLFGYSYHASAKEKTHEAVQDPRYGVALWHYFQGQNLQALTELMIAENKEGIQGHGDNPKIIKAGLELAYGMVNHSKAAFEKIADESLSPSVKNKAWYYLAKIYYQRGDLSSALSTLEPLNSLEENSTLRSKTLSLKLNVLIQQGDLSEAERLISTVNKPFPEKSMALFNLGNAHSRNGTYKNALKIFDKALETIKRQEIINKGDLFLADKIYISAGYSALLSGQPKRALSYFSQSQQQSLDSELALLGYGRAASTLEYYQQALAFFDLLAQQAFYKPAVQESLISVPVIYEKIQQPARALRAYEYAMTIYQQEISNIDSEIAYLRQQDLGALFPDKNVAGKGIHWLKSAEITPFSRDQPSYQSRKKFSTLFSEEKFQTDLRELQDLISLNDFAADRLNRLAIMKESLMNRQKDKQAQWLEYGSLQAEQKLKAYKNRLKQMTGLLQKAIDEKDYLAFIPDNRKELLERIKNSERRIDASNQYGIALEKEQREKQKNLLRVYRGMLFWQAAQDYSEEKYALEKAIQEMEQELNVLTNHQSRVETLLSDAARIDMFQYEKEFEKHSKEKGSEDSYLNRIERLERHTNVIGNRLDQKIADVKAKVFGSMVALLEDRQQILRRYLTHARLASLRIYEENSFVLNSATAPGSNALDSKIEAMP